MADDLDKLIAETPAATAAPPKQAMDLDRLIAETAAEPSQGPKPSALNAAGRGALQGASMGWSDEVGSALGAPLMMLARARMAHNGVHLTPQAEAEARAQGIPLPQDSAGPGYVDTYRELRDATRKANADAQAAHPLAYGASEFGGGVATSFIPGVGVAKGTAMLPAVLKLGAQGALAGLGGSNADLTRGEVGRAALDTGVGAGVGAGLGYLGGKLGQFVQTAADKVRMANADAGELANKAAQKAFRQARSSLGGETAAVLRDFEDMKVIAANAGGVHPPDVVAAAQAKLADPRYIAVVQNAAKNAVSHGADKLEGALNSARNVFDAARDAIQPEAVDARAAEMMANPIKNQFIPRLKTYATRAIPIAIGAKLGGIPGAVVGGVTSAALGAPGTALANAMKHPATRALVWGAGGAAAKALEPAVERSATSVGLQLDPQVAAMIAALRQQKPEEPSQ